MQRLKGKANEALGRSKQTAGRASGDRSTEVKGAGQTLKGKAQKTVGKARSSAKKATR